MPRRRQSVEAVPLEDIDDPSTSSSCHSDCSSQAVDASLDPDNSSSNKLTSNNQKPLPLPKQLATTSIPSRPNAFVIQVTAIASLGGILFGYDLGVISVALPQLIQTFDLTTGQSEIVVSILYLGGGLGACIGGTLCDACGRKQTILYTDLFFLLGALLLWLAPNFATVTAGRVVVGFAIAVSGIADVSYLHEIAPVQFRGAIVSVNEACISLGFLLAFGVGALFSAEGQTNGWRGMFGVSGMIALVQLLGMWKMPESPKWLAEQGRTEECLAARKQIEGEEADEQTDSHHSAEAIASNINPDYQTIVVTTTDSLYKAHVEGDGEHGVPLPVSGTVRRAGTLYYCVPQVVSNLYHQLRDFGHAMTTHYRRQAYIAVFLAVTQQLCGQTNVLSYAPLIFAAAAPQDDALDSNNHEVGSNSAMQQDYVRGWATVSIGLVKFAVTVVVIWKIERLGRRFLLLTGMTTIALGLLCLTLAFWELLYVEFLALPGILLVVCGYSMSFGPLTWLLTSELVPTDIRGRALGASTILTYLTASFVTYTFLSFQEWAGPSFVFFTYWIITSVGVGFAYVAIPDTGGKNVKEIEVSLDQMPWWRSAATDNWPLFPMRRRRSRAAIPPGTDDETSTPIHRLHHVEIS